MYLEVREVAVCTVCAHPDLDPTFYGFSQHVLLHTGSAFEANHGFINCIVTGWFVQCQEL